MDPIERTKHYFDKPFRGAAKKASPVEIFTFEEICKLMPSGSKTEFAVDLGCHWGRYTRKLAETYGFVLGVDFAAAPIITAPALPNVRYLQADLENDVFNPEGEVNLFIAIGLFEMLRRGDLVMQKMADHIAPDGEVLIVIPNKSHLHFVFLRFALWAARTFLNRKHVFIYHNGANVWTLNRAMEVAGFSVKAGGSIVGMPPSLLARLPFGFQRVLLRKDKLASAILGGAYHWLLFKK